ncbi:hypothetical protein ACJW30_10G109600 [Castanea mollissima]
MASLNYGTHGATSFYPSLPLATVASPDLRGYCDTDAPPSAASYTVLHIVGDLLGLIDHLGIDQVFLVGHDWGAMVAWNFCLFRPDRIKAPVNMSVVWFPRNPALNPVEESRASLGDDYYICRFQTAKISSQTVKSSSITSQTKQKTHSDKTSPDAEPPPPLQPDRRSRTTSPQTKAHPFTSFTSASFTPNLHHCHRRTRTCRPKLTATEVAGAVRGAWKHAGAAVSHDRKVPFQQVYTIEFSAVNFNLWDTAGHIEI